MIRASWVVVLIVGGLLPLGSFAAGDGNNHGQIPIELQPNPDASANRQILQTLTDIRDSQLASLKVQADILAILQSQIKPATPGQEQITASTSHRRKESHRHHGGRETVAAISGATQLGGVTQQGAGR